MWIKKIKRLNIYGLNQELSWIINMQFSSFNYSLWNVWELRNVWHYLCFKILIVKLRKISLKKTSGRNHLGKLVFKLTPLPFTMSNIRAHTHALAHTQAQTNLFFIIFCRTLLVLLIATVSIFNTEDQ